MQAVAADKALTVVRWIDILDPEKVFVLKQLYLPPRGNNYVPFLLQLMLFLSQHIKVLFIILIKLKPHFFFHFAVLRLGP